MQVHRSGYYRYLACAKVKVRNVRLLVEIQALHGMNKVVKATGAVAYREALKKKVMLLAVIKHEV